MSTIARPPLYRITVIQSLVALIVAAIAGTALSNVIGYSFFIGCLIQIAGSYYFARQAWRYRGARQVRTMVQAMYLGESGKMLLTAAMFAGVFLTIKPLSSASVFIGYIAMLGLYLPLAAKTLKHKQST